MLAIDIYINNRYVQTSLTNGSNSSRALKGTMRTLVGATRGGSDSTCNNDIRKNVNILSV